MRLFNSTKFTKLMQTCQHSRFFAFSRSLPTKTWNISIFLRKKKLDWFNLRNETSKSFFNLI